MPFIDDCTFIFEQLAVVFWKRILYWSTGEGMDKMEFIVAESDCTTLVGESQQYKEPFLSTDRASAGEVFYLFRVCLPLFSTLLSFKRVLFTLYPLWSLWSVSETPSTWSCTTPTTPSETCSFTVDFGRLLLMCVIS